MLVNGQNNPSRKRPNPKGGSGPASNTQFLGPSWNHGLAMLHSWWCTVPILKCPYLWEDLDPQLSNIHFLWANQPTNPNSVLTVSAKQTNRHNNHATMPLSLYIANTAMWLIITRTSRHGTLCHPGFHPSTLSNVVQVGYQNTVKNAIQTNDAYNN